VSSKPDETINLRPLSNARQIRAQYNQNMSTKKRFRPVWIVLHWLMALLVFVTFGIGLLSLTNVPNAGAKLVPLGAHMAIGIAILVIVTLRYILRLRVFKPARRAKSAAVLPPKKKLILLDRLTPWVHNLLYFFTALMALLGIGIALPANLFSIVWAGSGAPLPADFYVYPARAWHGTFSLILILLIAQHVLVAIYHQFLRGENYLGRMWFGTASPAPRTTRDAQSAPGEIDFAEKENDRPFR
jgi:cytochrome b561